MLYKHTVYPLFLSGPYCLQYLSILLLGLYCL